MYKILCTILVVLGLDVSHHQGKIDWDKVPTKYEYVYIKATEGTDWQDPKYLYNFNHASKKFNVGSYHYLTTSNIYKQFYNYKNNTKQQNLIPMVDVEIEGVKQWSKKELWENLDIFIELCEKEYGVKPIIYSTQRSYNTLLSPRYNNFILMIGRYSKKEPECKWDIWQYTEKGKIDGIKKNTDISKTSDISHIKYKDAKIIKNEKKSKLHFLFKTWEYCRALIVG